MGSHPPQPLPVSVEVARAGAMRVPDLVARAVLARAHCCGSRAVDNLSLSASAALVRCRYATVPTVTCVTRARGPALQSAVGSRRRLPTAQRRRGRGRAFFQTS
jgi:hypothetical protein